MGSLATAVKIESDEECGKSGRPLFPDIRILVLAIGVVSLTLALCLLFALRGRKRGIRERAIMDYIHHWNESGRRFVWTKSSKQILRNVRKAAQN